MENTAGKTRRSGTSGPSCSRIINPTFIPVKYNRTELFTWQNFPYPGNQARPPSHMNTSEILQITFIEVRQDLGNPPAQSTGLMSRGPTQERGLDPLRRIQIVRTEPVVWQTLSANGPGAMFKVLVCVAGGIVWVRD